MWYTIGKNFESGEKLNHQMKNYWEIFEKVLKYLYFKYLRMQVKNMVPSLNFIHIRRQQTVWKLEQEVRLYANILAFAFTRQFGSVDGLTHKCEENLENILTTRDEIDANTFDMEHSSIWFDSKQMNRWTDEPKFFLLSSNRTFEFWQYGNVSIWTWNEKKNNDKYHNHIERKERNICFILDSIENMMITLASSRWTWSNEQRLTETAAY